jgi:hypothetical protein
MPTDRNYGNVKNLSPQRRAVWDQTFESAMRIYNDKKFATGTAWRAIRLLDGNEPRPNPNGGNLPGVLGPAGWQKMPNPGDTIILGKLLEFAYLTNPPNVQFVKFNPGQEPDLLWSRENKMLVAYPHLSIPGVRLGSVSEKLRQEYTRWAQRGPRGSMQIEVPAYKITPAGAADTVVYRSSKWTQTPGDPPGAQEYIHQFGEKVEFERGRGEVPSAIVFRGGKLDVLPAGIVN